MTTKFVRLNYISGDFEIVEAPSLLNYARIRALHQQLLSSIQSTDLIVGEVWLPEADFDLYPGRENYYQKIGELLTPRINVSHLTYKSRHEFFICTPPPDNSNVHGLSRLEELMGMSYVQDEEDSRLQIEVIAENPTTNDIVLDVLADAMLCFKSDAWKLAEFLSPSDLISVICQANARTRQAEINSEESTKNTQDFTSRQSTAVMSPSSNEKNTTSQLSSDEIKKLQDLNIQLPYV